MQLVSSVFIKRRVTPEFSTSLLVGSVRCVEGTAHTHTHTYTHTHTHVHKHTPTLRAHTQIAVLANGAGMNVVFVAVL